jgi:cyclopropane-fatty-acyl-phospholipid synthase
MTMPARNTVKRPQRVVTALLDRAGIAVNGGEDWDLQVHDPRFYHRVLSGGSLALGEAYLDGWWDARSLDGFFTRLFEAGVERGARLPPAILLRLLFFRLFNPQGGKRAYQVGKRHYDTGNDLFERMLDRRLTYSCGYWKDAADLEAAQEAKLDLVCRKLRLRQGMRLLDIGCGWGSLLRFAARRHGVEALGVTVSTEQAGYARRVCDGLPVDIRVLDYRALGRQYDAIASIGMVEHVGWKNYAGFMEVAHRCLAPGGLFLLHTIGSRRSQKQTDPWIDKYIFPNSMLPSLAQLTRAAEPYFVVEDLQNFGPDYDRTLMAWDRNFRSAWPGLEARYGKRFYRMWRYYLMSSAASFRSRRIQLWQLVLARQPGRERYDAPR